MLHFKTLITAATGIVTLCSCADRVSAPQPVGPVPQAKQVTWQKRETTAFIHFGLNTFNNREWGYGDSDPATFNPQKLDCEQWVRTLQAAGMKGVIFTAKHHDGFCLWPTHLTEYCIRNTPYKNGQGDVVGELEKACRKYGMEFAVYLSPWDRHQANYATPEYVKFYHKQLEELLTRYGNVFELWFDGANGGDGWYGGAKDSRNIDRKNYYDYPTIFALADRYQPDAVIFGDGGPGCRWVGNEKGFAGETNWSFLRKNTVYPGYPNYFELTSGHSDGDQWTPAECDVSIRPGWFWHEEENSKVKTPAQLTDLYYKSVGRNGLLLLNFPVNADGLISKEDSISGAAFYQNIQAELSRDLLQNGVKIEASSTRGKRFAASSLTDGKYDTYWATPDGVTQGEVSFTFKQETPINRLLLQEYIPLGQRVQHFSVFYESNGALQPLSLAEETTTIGYKRLLRFETIRTQRLVVRIDASRGPLCLNRIAAYHADTPIARGEMQQGADQLPKGLALTLTGIQADEATKATDRNAATVAFIDGNTLNADLGSMCNISAFHYLPDCINSQNIITNYELWVADDNRTNPRMVASGEFSNIRNNPMLQTLRFSQTRARYVWLVAKRIANGEGKMGVAEIAVE